MSDLKIHNKNPQAVVDNWDGKNANKIDPWKSIC